MKTLKLKADKKKWAKAAFGLVGLAAMIYWRAPLLEIFSMIGDRDAIVAFLQGYGLLGPLVLSVILGLQVFLAVIPGHAFIVAGGYIYGLLVGAAITQVRC